jgi:hypothetical protein
MAYVAAGVISTGIKVAIDWKNKVLVSKSLDDKV